ncbi:MAG: hypothetical protein ACKOE6_16650 [Flammeovirgaceae bacterium]
MISPLSHTGEYILQPTLIWKHKKTLEWISTATFWKRELAFFQKLLDEYAPRFSSEADKMKIGHFQSLIIYYRDELINQLTSKLRLHEKRLAELLEKKNESDVEYFKEHADLMGELDATSTQFSTNKEELFSFIERVM